jgi:hypothetical protein
MICGTNQNDLSHGSRVGGAEKSADDVNGLPKGGFQPQFDARISTRRDANPKRGALFGMLIENYLKIVRGSKVQKGFKGPQIGLPLVIEIAEKDPRD